MVTHLQLTPTGVQAVLGPWYSSRSPYSPSHSSQTLSCALTALEQIIL